MQFKQLIGMLFSGFLAISSFGQTLPIRTDSLQTGSRPIRSIPGTNIPLNKLTVGGYYRFFGINRDLKQDFVVLPGNPYANAPAYVLGTGDVYRDPPMMLLNLSVQPNSKTYVGMDYALYHNFSGQPGTSPINLNLGINLTGSIQTSHGKFTAHLGGINWIDVSGMVFSSFIGYQRFSIFERWPWEGNALASARALNYVENGTISRDMRFGMQPFKGLMIDGLDLPWQTQVRLLYGTTPNAAAFAGNQPSITQGGRLRKKLGPMDFGLNGMDYSMYLDSLAKDKSGIQLYTVSWDLKLDWVEMALEAGRGRLYSPYQNQGWGEAARFSIKSGKKWKKLPIEAEAFYLSPQFINYYGNFLSPNTTILSAASVEQGATANASSGGISSFAGSITDVGQVSNNRKGISINAWFNPFRNTYINLGNMAAQEIETLSNDLSFGHKINALPFSRFAPFTSNMGVYKNWTSYFRGYSQGVKITDSTSRKQTGFTMLQVQFKQKLSLLGKPVYLLYLASLGSATEGFSAVPEFSNKAYLRTHYHEADLIVGLNKNLSLCASYGLERIQGNNRLNRGDNKDGVLGSTANDPVNQSSSLIGLGLDLAVSKNTNLYVRHRRMKQQDKSFTLDQIEGTETTIELKLFF
ncbi:hypothetical protein MASR2M44_10320 [Bacteroidota bacterium]